MSLITGTLAPLLKIKFKPRCDDCTDQFNRILMVKISMISCIVLGITWLKGTMSCIMPDQSGIDGGFVTQTCWIQGEHTSAMSYLVSHVLLFSIIIINKSNP